jgi:sulfhydrogenase subunit alpha
MEQAEDVRSDGEAAGGGSMRKIEIEHLCRVEGAGGVKVKMAGDRIEDVKVNVLEGPRMFEAVTLGRKYDEIPDIVSRICAICSSIHFVTSTLAVEDALGIQVTEQTRLLRELLVYGGNIESHALHIFCLALPDLIGYPSVIEMAGDHLDAVAKALRLKKLGNTIQEVIGGRMVHQTNLKLGGFGKLPAIEDLSSIRSQLEKELSEAMEMMELMATLDIPDFPTSPTTYAAVKPDDMYNYLGNKVAVSTGEVFDVHDYKELTNERVVPHSHAKHSMFNETPFMVGSLARVMINGDMLTGKARETMEMFGLDKTCENILMNNAAQGVELVQSLERSMGIVDYFLINGIKEEEAIHIEPGSGKGTAAGEAPRGTLYHSYEFDDDGRAVDVDVITPTAQNYANMEKDVRASMERIKSESDDDIEFKLNMVIRAYDPCISCSVH